MKKIILLSVFLALCTINSYAAFNDTYWGVRPLGMGGAFTAVVNDANAPLYNPAGLANVEKKELTFMGARLFTGLEGVEIGANYLAYTHPLPYYEYGTLALAWASTAVPGLRREDTVNLGYGRNLNDVFNLDWDLWTLAAGLNLKYLRQEVNFDESDSDVGSSKGAVTADIGLLAQFTNGLSVGLSSKYLTSPDIGFVSSDKVGNVNVIGVAYYNELLPKIYIPYFTAAVDFLMREDENDFRLGLESYVIDGKLALRAGGRQEALNIGFGYEFIFESEAKLIIDYALEIPLQVEESMGSHFISLSFRFP